MKRQSSVLRSIFRRSGPHDRSVIRHRLRLERLEKRSVLTVTPSLSGDLLSISVVDDKSASTAFLRLEGSNIEVADNVGFANAASFSASQVSQILIQGGTGAESVRLSSGHISASLATYSIDAVAFASGTAFSGPVSITNSGSDTSLDNVASLAGSLTTQVSGGKLVLSGDFSAATGVRYNAPVVLKTDVEVDGGVGNVTFGGTVDAAASGGQSLLVTSPGRTTFASDVGGRAALKSITTRSVTPLVAPTLANTTVNIPLYYLPQSGDYYTPGAQPPTEPDIKYGIEVSVGENNPARMYLFDTGGQGFFPAYSEEAFGGVTPGTTPAPVQYTSGLFYNGFVTSAKVTIGSGTESVSTAVPVDFGAWPTGGNIHQPGLVFRSATTDKTGQLYGDFGGAFGFADPDATDQSPGLASILYQLPGNYSSGYVVRLGPVGGPASLTIGITDDLRSQFPYSIPLTAASNPFDPSKPLLYPVSNRPAFEDFAFSPNYTISNGSTSYDLGPLPTICDTGAPSTSVRYPNDPPTTPFPFTRGTKSFVPGTDLTASFPTADGKPPLTWSQTIGGQQSVDEFGYMDSTGQASSSNNVNTGLNLFNHYDVMFDVERGRIRLRPNAGIGTVTVGSVTTTGDQTFTQNIDIGGGLQSTAGKLSIGGKAYVTADSTLATTAGNPIDFQNTIDGKHSLVITTDGTVTFGSSVGVFEPLDSLSVTAGKTMFPLVSVATVSTQGAQSYAGPAWINGTIVSSDKGVRFKGKVNLAGPSVVMSKSEGVAFDATIDGDKPLSVSAQTTIAFNDTVGGTTPVPGLTLTASSVTAKKPISLDGTAAGAQADGLAVSAGTSVSLSATGSKISGFQGTGILFAGDSVNSLVSGFTLSKNIGSGIRFSSANGSSTKLSGTRVSGNTIIDNSGFGVEFSSPVIGLSLTQNTIGQAGSANPWGFVSGGPNTHGIVLAAGSYAGTVIASNTIRSNRRDGIYAPGGVTSLAIIGNAITGNGAHGIEFFSGDFGGTQIQGNSITDNNADGIALGTGMTAPAAGGNPASGYTGVAEKSGHYLLDYFSSPLEGGIVQNDPSIKIDCPIFDNGETSGSTTTYDITLDTGSRGLYVDITGVVEGTNLGTNLGYVYLNSSNRVYYGNWVNQTISFPASTFIDANGNAHPDRNASAVVPVLVVTALGATTTPIPGSTKATATFRATQTSGSVTITNGTSTTTVPITPAGLFTVPGGWWAEYLNPANMVNGASILKPVSNFGIGFDRTGQGTFSSDGYSNQGYNAFLNLTEMQKGTMRSGYVITPEHVTLGLDESVSGYSYTALSPTGLAKQSGSPPDWQPATGTLNYGGQSYATGPIVIDMGLSSGILTLPGQTATSAFNQSMTVNLLNSGGAFSYDINYNQTNDTLNPSSISFYSPLPGNYSSNAPTQNSQFFNTGRYPFTAFKYLYDATGGYLGLAPTKLPNTSTVLASANASVPSTPTFFPNPGAPVGVSGVTIGAMQSGAGNTISGNVGAGISVTGAGSVANTITGNSIASNGGPGISLRDGANSGQHAPALATSSAYRTSGSVTISGTLTATPGYSGQYLIQFFTGSANGRGQPSDASHLLGSITQSAGTFTAVFPLTAASFGDYVIATATPVPAGSTLAGSTGTSEFSKPSRIDTVLVTSRADSGLGTLRNAIRFGNQYSFPKTITFQTPAGSSQFFVGSALPAISTPTTINGAITNGAGQTTGKATINGSRIKNPANGLTITPSAVGSAIVSLGIQGFTRGSGIVVRANNVGINSSVINDNLIGVNLADVSGANVSFNTLSLSGHGILASGGLSGSVAVGNTISRSRLTGVRLVNATGLTVGVKGIGNTITGTGTTSLATAGVFATGLLTGTVVQGNRIQSGGNGIILNNARSITVGGTATTPRAGENTILANRGIGLYGIGACTKSAVSGNTVVNNRQNVSISQARNLSYLPGVAYVSPFAVPLDPSIAIWTSDFAARTSAIVANSTPAQGQWYGYNYVTNRLPYGPLNPQLLTAPANVSTGLDPAGDRGNAVNQTVMNTCPDGVEPSVWYTQRLLAAALSLIGTPYQHLHIPQFNPAQVAAGGFQWSAVSNNPDLTTTQMLSNTKDQPTVANPYLAAYGQPAAGIDCTDFSAYIYNLALGIQMHSGVASQITFKVDGTPTTSNLTPDAVPSATVLNPDGTAISPKFWKAPTFGQSQINQPGSLTDITNQLRAGDLLYIGNPTDGVLHVVMWLGVNATDSAGNTFPLVISSHDNTPAIFDTAAVNTVTGLPIDKNIVGHLPPPGVQILPFHWSNWFYQDFMIAMRVLPRT